MPVMYVSSHRGPCVNDLVSLLFAVCIFLTFLSQVELSQQLDVEKVGGGDGSPINLTQRVARIENNNSGSSGFKDTIAEAACSKKDVSVREGYIGSVANGIPAFAVEIMNTCVTGFAIANIHIRCGAFASAVEVNPRLFRRLAYGDCLVNDGKKLEAGRIVSFRYANSFMYPLSVASVKCLR